MPKGKHIPQALKDEILEKVALYQSEHKSTRMKACRAIGEKYGIKTDTIYKWKQLRGKDLVIPQVAKKKDRIIRNKNKTVKVAATSVSSSANFEAEKIIFNYVKNLSFFKRILACIIGLDKLCYNYGGKKMD